MEAIAISRIIQYLKIKNFCFSEKVDKDIDVKGFSSLTNYKAGTVTWVKSQSNVINLDEEVALCIVQEGVEVPYKNQIITNESKKVFFTLIEEVLADKEVNVQNIGEFTTIGPHVSLGKNVVIGNGCSITGQVSIGNGTLISDNVVIKNRVKIGENCVIQALTVIGEDGYAYTEDFDGSKRMVKHYGGVEIGDDVFIGTHVNIARGTIDNTIIKKGSKIAPSTHIGHNVCIEEDSTVICSQLYGSVHLGASSYVVGSIVKNQCSIGENSLVGMGSVVTRDIDKNKIVVGQPAKIIRNNEEKRK